MTQTKQLSPLVKRVLAKNPSARESYNFLYLCILGELGLHLTLEQRDQFLHMPSFESIGRAARKLVESGEFTPTKRTQRRRKALQQEYKQEMVQKWTFDEYGNARLQV